ncbi:DNA polymerase IV [Candidatus Peregrinibacteria bacterium]|nr:DNA polymerase IV [Candidatus Peregrinibacteria bacterium]
MPNRISYPTAIAHIDCNAFFASVEQAYNPTLQGKPVLVTGMGGGCVIASSYEAKKYGIGIGASIWETKKAHPEIVIVPGNFRRYLIYQRNFLEIIRQFTPDVEVASIDECYVDLKGLRRLYHKPYREICQDIKETIKKRLGITVSIGLSTTKMLAKTASNFRKPDGLTVIGGKDVEQFLAQVDLNQIKGFGSNTRALLKKHGIHTPLEFIKSSPQKIQKLLGKAGLEMQMELSGYSARSVRTAEALPKSLARTRSFHVTTNQDFIYQQILTNLSMAFWHLRRKKLKTTYITLMLRDQNYRTYGQEIKLPEELNSEIAIVKLVKNAFDQLFQPNLPYRSSGIITSGFSHEDFLNPKLFPNELETDQQISLFHHLDQITDKYGLKTITLATTMKNFSETDPISRLYLPYIGSVN